MSYGCFPRHPGECWGYQPLSKVEGPPARLLSRTSLETRIELPLLRGGAISNQEPTDLGRIMLSDIIIS